MLLVRSERSIIGNTHTEDLQPLQGAVEQDKLLAKCLEEVGNANSQLGRDLPRLQEMPQHCIQLDSLGVPGADLVHLIGDAADERGKHLDYSGQGDHIAGWVPSGIILKRGPV